MIKTSRNEMIMTTVNHYLRRRQYMDAGDAGQQKKSRLDACSIQDMALSYAVANCSSTGQTVSFSSLSGDAALWDQQYCRIRAFVADSAEPLRSELSQILFPSFVRIFLELFAGDQKISAQRFFAKHHSMFSDVEEAKQLIGCLEVMSTRDDLTSNKIICEFREHKYSVTLSENHLLDFINYLKGDDNLMMLQILTQHLDISVKGPDIVESVVEDELDEPHSSVSKETAAPESVPTDVTTESLQRIIRKLKDDPPPLPSIHLYLVINAHKGPSCVTMSPDEQLLCAGFEDSRIQLWGLAPGARPDPVPVFGVSHLRLANDHPEDIEARIGQRPSNVSDDIVLRAHSDAVYGLSFLTDHRYLLSASTDKTVRLWDMNTCSNVVCYRGHNYPVVSVDSSPVSSFFASSSFDQTCLLWHSTRNYPLRTFIGHTRTVNCVKFHPNGNYLATGSSDMSIRLWDLQTAESKRVFSEHKGMVMALAFSPNGKYLASAGEDNHIKVWDLTMGRVVRDFKGHTEMVYSLAFSPCSSLIASGGHDNVINIWDVDKVTSSSCTSSDGTSVPVETTPLGSYPTKSVSVYYLNFSKRNFLQAAGS